MSILIAPFYIITTYTQHFSPSQAFIGKRIVLLVLSSVR